MVTSVVRSLLDEGVGTTVADDTGNGNTCTFDPSAGDAAWTSIAAGNGIDYTAAISTAGTAIVGLQNISANGTIGSSFGAGTQQLSFVIVCELDAGDAAGPRLVQIGTDGGDGDFAIGVRGSDLLFRWSKESGGSDVTYPVPNGGYPTTTKIIHVSIDSTQATAADRIKVWYDKVLQTAVSGTIALNESVDLDNTAYNYSLGNRYTLNRNIDGKIYYAELLTGNWTDQEVIDSYDALVLDNDSNWADTGVTGTVAETLDDVTSTGAGNVTYNAVGAATLDDVTSTSTGDVTYNAVGAATFDDITSTAAGKAANLATTNESFEDVTSTAAGKSANLATTNESLDDITSTGAGEVTYNGVINETLDDVTSTASGTVITTNEGTVDETFEDVTSTSTGLVGLVGSTNESLEDVFSGSVALIGSIASTNATFEDVSSTAAAEVKMFGSSAATLEDVVSVASGVAKNSGSIDENFEDVTSTATGNVAPFSVLGSVDKTFEDATSDATATVQLAVTGVISQTMEDIGRYIIATVEVENMLITDPTSALYNSYVTGPEANVLIAGLEPFVDTTAWFALTGEQQANVILRATDNANSFQYIGATSSVIISPENMMWPRRGTRYANGVAILDTEIPTFMKEYIAQRCTEILEFGPTDANNLTVPNNVRKQKVGSLEQEFFSPQEMTANTLELTDFVSYGFIKPYVINSGNVKFLKRS